MVLAKMGYITVYPKTRYTYRYIDIYILCVYIYIHIIYIYTHYIYNILVGGLEHFLFFHSVGNFIIPTDFHIFQRCWNHQPVCIYIYCIYIYIYVLLCNSESLAFRHGWIFAESWSSWLSPGCWGSRGLSDGSPKIIASLSPRVSTIYIYIWICVYIYI